jgi:hypothetical protein
MEKDATAAPYGHAPIPNGDFVLKKDGRMETKKTENCDNVAAWVSSSAAAWTAGLEAGSYRRGKHALYMNKGAWVEQELQTVPVVGGAWYTIRVDACRSAEKADQVVVEVFADGRLAHTEKVGPLANGWKTYQTQWHSPADLASTAVLKLRFTMVKAWGQIDNVRMHVGKAATSLADEAAAIIAERAAKEEAAFAMEAGGTPLNTAWSIWEHRKTGNKMTSDAAYLSGIARVADFRTIQGFFQFWNQLPLPSEFFTNEKGQRRAFEDRQLDGLSVFREGLSPTWEDPMNADGGEFFIRTSGNQMSLRQLDEYWEQTVLGMIGETLDPGCEICGARVVDKSKSRGPAYRLELWFRRNSPPGIGEDIKGRYAKCLSEVVERGGRPPKLDYRNHKF